MCFVAEHVWSCRVSQSYTPNRTRTNDCIEKKVTLGSKNLKTTYARNASRNMAMWCTLHLTPTHKATFTSNLKGSQAVRTPLKDWTVVSLVVGLSPHSLLLTLCTAVYSVGPKHCESSSATISSDNSEMDIRAMESNQCGEGSVMGLYNWLAQDQRGGRICKVCDRDGRSLSIFRDFLTSDTCPLTELSRFSRPPVVSLLINRLLISIMPLHRLRVQAKENDLESSVGLAIRK